MPKALAVAISIALTLAVLSPLTRDPSFDSFPLSDYPMFSYGRPSPMMEIEHALGVDADGTRRALPPIVSSGNREVLQSWRTIGQAIEGGRAETFCEEVAQRVVEDGDFDDVLEVEIASSEYDAVRYFEAGPTPINRVVHARCAVRR